MAKKLYVGNLPWSVMSSDLEDALRGMGIVFKTAEVVYDRETDRSRGFAFVHFELDESAEMARESLDGYVMGGRTLVANMATSERREKPSGRKDFSRATGPRATGPSSRGDHQQPRRGRGGRAGGSRGDDDRGGW